MRLAVAGSALQGVLYQQILQARISIQDKESKKSNYIFREQRKQTRGQIKLPTKPSIIQAHLDELSTKWLSGFRRQFLNEKQFSLSRITVGLDGFIADMVWSTKHRQLDCICLHRNILNSASI